MKNKLLHLVTLALLGSACTLPDVKTLNPPHLLDGPAFNITPSGSGQATANGAKGYNGNTLGITYLTFGSTTDFAVDVVDCPGKVSDLSASLSSFYAQSVTVDAASLASLKGQATGSSKVTVVAANDPDGTGGEWPSNLAISVTDSQKDPEASGSPITATVQWPIALVKCLSTGITTGTYQVTAASGVLDSGSPYFGTAYTLADIESDNGGPVYVTITAPRPGRYTFDEVTGGIWPIYFSGRARPTLGVNLCDQTVSDNGTFNIAGSGSTARRFTLSGTLNNDGTITMTWSYIRIAGGTPTSPANGTYTLTKI